MGKVVIHKWNGEKTTIHEVDRVICHSDDSITIIFHNEELKSHYTKEEMETWWMMDEDCEEIQ